jgi:DtxR family Mn-dependent transcriptional regulator
MPANHEISAVAEDYLEAILKLSGEKGAARVRDLAAELGVHKSTVSLALKALAEKGLVDYSPYEMARLTPDGEAVANEVTRSHEVIRRFLVRVLGMDEATAGENACRAEHVIDDSVKERMAAAVRLSKSGGDAVAGFRTALEGFMKKEAHALKRGRAGGAGVALAEMREGSGGTVCEIRGGRGMVHRLAEMGIKPGTALTLVRGRGPAIVECGGHRLIIGRGMVEDIMVKPA